MGQVCPQYVATPDKQNKNKGQPEAVIMSAIPQIFDHALLTARRVKALKRAEQGADFLLREVAEDMDIRLSMVLRDFPVCVELGGHTGLLAQRLEARKGTEQVYRLEQHPDFFQKSERGIVADAEMLPLATESCHLIVSPLFLHWVNDLPGSLIQIRHVLKPDGLFLATLLGRESLQELRDVFLTADSEISGGASPRVCPFARPQGYGQPFATGGLHPARGRSGQPDRSAMTRCLI